MTEIPHDRNAERAVLGSMLLSADAVKVVCGILRTEDFYEWQHQRVFEVVCSMQADGRPIDALQVNAALQASGELTKLGSTFLFDLIRWTPMPASAEHYARIVRDQAKLREVLKVTTRIMQMVHQPGPDTADALVEHASEQFAAIKDYGLTDDLGTMRTPSEIRTTAEERGYDWLIPNILERGDRVLLTGAEGLGKSMLLRQIAVSLAVGLHPFTHKPIDPLRVLAFDLENPRAISDRMYRLLFIAAEQAGYPIGDGKLAVDVHPQGLDITTTEDRRWFTRRVEAWQPDLLVVGPLYKLHVGNPNEEETARNVAAFLDRTRTNAQCGLIAETHAPKSSEWEKGRPLAPVGSSLWMRWPEFGIGISYVKSRDKAEQAEIERHRLVDLRHWRGPRDERDWPARLRAGGEWPWSIPQGHRWASPELSPADRAAGEREDPWENGGQLR